MKETTQESTRRVSAMNRLLTASLLTFAIAVTPMFAPTVAYACAALGDGCCDSTSGGICECGDEVRSNVTLTRDVVCSSASPSGPALAVVASGAVLRLDGFQVACVGSANNCAAQFPTGVVLAA